MKLGPTPFACIAALSLAFASACSSASPTDFLPVAAVAPPSSSNDEPAEALSSSSSGSPAATSDGGAVSNRVRDGGSDSPAGDAGPDADALYQSLPIVGGVDAPTIAAVTVRCAASRQELDSEPAQSTFPAAFARIVSVTDPQGVTDVFFNSHQLVLYPSVDGLGGEAHTFGASIYGITFGLWELGTYFAGNTAVLTELCARAWWPGEITVTDSSGHVTASKVRVPIVH